MKSKLANRYVVICYMGLVKLLARCSPFSIGSDVEKIGCVIFRKSGDMFMIFPDSTYSEGLLIVHGSDGGESFNFIRGGRVYDIWWHVDWR